MLKSCKNIDITDYRTDYAWVYDCISRHYKRYDFKRLLMTTGHLTKEEYRKLLDGDLQPLQDAAVRIAKVAARGIKSRKLGLTPAVIGTKHDKSTGKDRLIGKESAMQQVYDYIAKGAADPIWKRRIVPQQASSIKDRGQCYGISMISNWIKKDQRADAWAKRHGRRYARKCKYFVKLDIKKCYPSMRADTFLKYFRRDCANEDLIWLWDTLLQSHKVILLDNNELYEGFMIGALPSQWACQYLLSFAYRYAMSLHTERRDKKIRLVNHALIFMDDFYLSGSSYKNLKTAVHKITGFVKSALGLTIKPNWQILCIDRSPVDMMGYRVHKDGNVTVRPRVFLHARRALLRAMRLNSMCLRQARRLTAYKGYFEQKRRKAPKQFKHYIPLRSRRIIRKLKMRWAFKLAAHMERYETRRKQNESNLLRMAA